MKKHNFIILFIQVVLVSFTLFMWKSMIRARQIENDKADLGFRNFPGINIKEF